MDSELASVDGKIRDFLTNFDSAQSILAAFKSVRVAPLKGDSPLNRIKKDADMQFAELEQKINASKPMVEDIRAVQQIVQNRKLQGSRGSVILTTTLCRILPASEGEGGSGGEQARVATDLLMRWLQSFGYQPVSSMMQLLFSKLGSAALLESLSSRREAAERDGEDLLGIRPAYGPFCITAVAVALEQPKLCSADDASLWLLFASRLGGTVLQDAVSGEGEVSPDLLGAALQRVLREVGPRGSITAVVEASVKRLSSCWNQSLAEATVSALPRLETGQQQAHLFVECLPLERFGHQPPPDMVQLLFSKLGSAALQEALSSKLQAAERDGKDLLRIHPAYGSFCGRAVAIALEQPKLCSADDASLWLLFASRLGGTVLQDAVSGEGEVSPDFLGAALQRVLQEVGPRGSVTAVLEASVRHLGSYWDQGLAEATISALPRLDASLQQARLFVECLPLAQRCQAATGNCSALLQLLRMPQAATAFKALGRGQDAARAVANAVGSLLPSRAASASPAAARSSYELLQMSTAYDAELPACTYEMVMEAAAGSKQKDLAEASLAAFFQAEHLASCVPAWASLRALITMPGMAPHAFLAAAACSETGRHQLFLDAVVSISAAEGLQSWAFAAVAEAVRGGLRLHPDAVSSLVEAFLSLPEAPSVGSPVAAASPFWLPPFWPGASHSSLQT